MWCLKSYVTTPLFLTANSLKHHKLACSFSIVSVANRLRVPLFSFLPDTSMLTSKLTAEPVLVFLPNIQVYKYRFYQGFRSRPWEPMQTPPDTVRDTRIQKWTRASSLGIKKAGWPFLGWVGTVAETWPLALGHRLGVRPQRHRVIYPMGIFKYKIFCLADWS